VADRVVYGDTDGTIAGPDGAGSQTVPQGNLSEDGFRPALVFGDADVLDGSANGGDDVVRPGSYSFSAQFGDARTISGSAGGGNDVLEAGASYNVLHGDASAMTGEAQGGDDLVRAGSGGGARAGTVNMLYGDAHRMGDRAQGGDDTLIGAGDGYYSGATMYGDAYEMTGRAQGGDDRLVSDCWSEEMWGDARVMAGEAEGGRDVFVFAPYNGRDTIHDFEPGRDRIDLSAFTAFGLRDFDGLAPKMFEQDDGTLIVLDFPGRPTWTTIPVEGASGLDEGDLVFG
jgi:hypothetical protein